MRRHGSHIGQARRGLRPVLGRQKGDQLRRHLGSWLRLRLGVAAETRSRDRVHEPSGACKKRGCPAGLRAPPVPAASQAQRPGSERQARRHWPRQSRCAGRRPPGRRRGYLSGGPTGRCHGMTVGQINNVVVHGELDGQSDQQNSTQGACHLAVYVRRSGECAHEGLGA